MATEPKSRRRRRKKILMKSDGSLYDASERRRITQAELRDYVRDGGLFEARRHESGADCSFEVLQTVMGVSFLQNLVPGLGGGGLPGLSSLANTGGGLADIARALGGGDRSGGWDDDWNEPPRRRKADERGWGDVDGDSDFE